MPNRMSWLALKNIRGSRFRSLTVLLASMLVAALALTSTLTLRGAENSLDLAMRRLGADLVVVPEGAGSAAGTALLVSIPAGTWMPAENLDRVASVPGVSAVSPQLYLGFLPPDMTALSTCPGSDLYVAAYDPQTDFTIGPWLESRGDPTPARGEAVGGSCFTSLAGQRLNLSGHALILKASLEATGTGLDQALFVTLETAGDLAQASQSAQAESTAGEQRTEEHNPLQVSFQPGYISSILATVDPGADLNQVSAQILRDVPGVTAISSPSLFQSYRQQMSALARMVLLVLGLILGISAGIVGLVFSLAAHQRHREVGVLRALGAKQGAVFKVLLVEAGMLAVTGGLAGVSLSALAIYLFREQIVRSIGFPLYFPGLAQLFWQVSAGLFLAILTVLLAALLPAYRASRQDPAIAMRE